MYDGLDRNGWHAGKVRDWLLAIVRFAVTLEPVDRQTVLAISQEMDGTPAQFLCGAYADGPVFISISNDRMTRLGARHCRPSGLRIDLVRAMTVTELPTAGDRIVEPMIGLARCTASHRIIVAGAKSLELMFELQRRGFLRATATANCGRAAGQYDVALVDWRRRTFRDLETTLARLRDFLAPTGVLVVWVDPQKPAAMQRLRTALIRRGFVVEAGTVREDGYAVSARRSETRPISKAA